MAARALARTRVSQYSITAKFRPSGVIVNVSSVNGRVSSPLRAAYGASKFALEALTESLHLEVRHFGIRCVLIEPGTIAPGMKASEPHKGPADYAGLWEQWAGADTKMTGPSVEPDPKLSHWPSPVQSKTPRHLSVYRSARTLR